MRVRFARWKRAWPALTLAVAALVALGVVASTSEQSASAAGLLWSGGMETGNVSEWSQSGGGGIYNSGTGVASASTDYARSGKYSAKMTITNASGASQAVRMFRWAESRTNPKAYYSVWYYFPQKYSGMSWWNIYQWKSKIASTGANDPMFTLNVGTRSDGSMYLYLYDHLRNKNVGNSAINIPVGKWFQVQGYYSQALDSTGQVTFWQDGQKIIDVPGVQTRRSGDEIQWSVDNYTDRISPSTATIYADDAAVSTSYR